MRCLKIKQCRLVFNEFTLYKLLVIVVYNPFAAASAAAVSSNILATVFYIPIVIAQKEFHRHARTII